MSVDISEYGESPLIEIHRAISIISKAPVEVRIKFHDEYVMAGLRTGKQLMTLTSLAARMVFESVAMFLRALHSEEE